MRLAFFAVLVSITYCEPQLGGLGGLFGVFQPQQQPQQVPYYNQGQFNQGQFNQGQVNRHQQQQHHQPVEEPTNDEDATDSASGKQPYETHYPCKTQTLTQVRPHGKVTPETNYWEGSLDLSDYTYLKTIKLVIKVDNPAELEVDQEVGRISGPHRGTVFRVTYFGTPEEVSEVKFKIVGTNGVQFPNLVSLNLNNRDICKEAVTWVNNLTEELTEVLLDTTHNLGLDGLLGGLGLMGNNQGHQQRPNQHMNNNHHTNPTHTTPRTTTTVRTKPTRRILPGCGRRQINQQAYITEGWTTKPGDWPWHAALYHRSSRTSSYKCGGTLISDRVVVTAAHCLYTGGKAIVPERVTVQLGKFNLNVLDSHTDEYQVFNITIHPEYSPIDFQDDLALMKLAELVTYTQYIQPACLWKETQKPLSFVEKRSGTVIGWGLTEHDELAEVLNEGTMPVVDFFTCLESDRDFFGPFLSDYNYCAGYRNGTSVCNGDSGGGMFFNEDGQWHLRGLVSFSSVREDKDVCNPKNYVIFTDVAKYLDWIYTNMK